MPNFYTYLISSLPMLQFGAKPPFTANSFIEYCRGLIGQEELNLLQEIFSNPMGISSSYSSLFNVYKESERQLRNELVKLRAGRKKIDPNKYIRGEDSADAYIGHAASLSYRNPSILEGERTLDQKRWEILDNLALGHYFDFDLLVIYALKLLIMQKWQAIAEAKEEIVDAIYG